MSQGNIGGKKVIGNYILRLCLHKTYFTLFVLVINFFFFYSFVISLFLKSNIASLLDPMANPHQIFSSLITSLYVSPLVIYWNIPEIGPF